MMAEQEEIKQENISLKMDTLTLHSKKENLLCDVSVLDGELEKRLDFINLLDKLKAILDKLLSMIPVVREFVRLVEEKRDIRAASPYGYTPLGRLLKEHRTPLPRYERIIKVFEIREEITLENRICTMEQAEVYMKAVESFMEEMNTPESARDNRPVYRTHNEEYQKGR